MNTIFAPITSQISSSVLCIRISGENAIEAVRILGFSGKIFPRKATLFRIFNPKNKEIIDEALFTYFKAPHSFTGEDVIEICIHNSSYILKKITEIFLTQPEFRFAEAGEFSKRAFLNGKIDLVQAEAIPDLIRSETESSHRQAINQLQGKLGKIYENWRKKIIEITAHIAALIDFPDEEIPPEIYKKICVEVEILNEEIVSHLSDNKVGQKIKEGIKVAIIGAPNVGKSSLLNFLADSEVAIVSEYAGTTRDVIEVRLEIAGILINLYDTAGIRESDDFIEQEGIKRALKKAQEADIKILVLDAKNMQFSDLKPDSKTLLVVNKIDELEDFVKIKQGKSFQNLDEKLEKIFGKNLKPILISVSHAINLNQLFSELESKIKEIIPNQNSNFLTQERYRSSLEKVHSYLSQFLLQKNIENQAEELRAAAFEIGKITGKIAIDDVLDVVFSSFCIGK